MNNHHLKKAVVEQIVLWIFLFISFVSFLFFVIDYSNATKVKNNTDAVADYLARMVAIDKNEADIVTGINNIKDNYFQDVAVIDLVCNLDAAISNRQVIVNVYATLNNNFLPVGNNNVHSRAVVFNESSEFQKECSLTLSFN